MLGNKFRQFHLFKNIIKKPIKENLWDEWDENTLKNFLRSDMEGINSPSRVRIREILRNYPNASLLDVGCGTAVELEGYIKNDVKVKYSGIDSSSKMLKVAREMFPSYEFTIGNIKDLQFKDNSFDIVLIRHLLEHLESYEKAMLESFRVANKIVIVNFFIELNGSLNDAITTRGDEIYNNSYSRRKYERFLKEDLGCAGFENIKNLGRSNYSQNEIYLIYKGCKKDETKSKHNFADFQ